MPANLLQLIELTTLNAEQITACTRQIHSAVLSQSKYIENPNFTNIHPDDLELLFAQYDKTFFDDQIKQALGGTILQFGLSKRMTSSGGKTVCLKDRADPNCRRFEIIASTTLLFQCFVDDDHRPIICSGITCSDRLDALQRVIEHELVHLIEMLLWGKSSCSKPRFHSISLRFFGHTENRHQLITPKEKAFVKFGIKPGVQVRFRLDGVEHAGIVNRVNKRATVLVKDGRGEEYSDGKRYTKFYVPVQMLETVD